MKLAASVPSPRGEGGPPAVDEVEERIFQILSSIFELKFIRIYLNYCDFQIHYITKNKYKNFNFVTPHPSACG